jgi:hypothetical protein
MNDDLKLQNIRAVLLRDWDPADIGDNPNLADEYDDYLAEVFNLLRERADESRLYEHLLGLEKDFGIQLPEERRAKTVEALFKLESAD